MSRESSRRGANYSDPRFGNKEVEDEPSIAPTRLLIQTILEYLTIGVPTHI